MIIYFCVQYLYINNNNNNNKFNKCNLTKHITVSIFTVYLLIC